MIFSRETHVYHKSNTGIMTFSSKISKRLLKNLFSFLTVTYLITFFFLHKEPKLELESVNVKNFELSDSSSSYYTPENEKFLTYLPHSQFHNQLIELKNAIMLAYLTNRTLIMPPILRFGNRRVIVPYRPFNELYQRLNDAENIKKHRLLCNINPEGKYCSHKYNYYDGFIMINWEEIFDFSWIKSQIKIINRYDFSIESLYKICNIPIIKKEKNAIYGDLLKDSKDVHFLDQENARTMYYHKFFDTTKHGRLGKYKVPYLIGDLQKVKEKLIHTNDLFGSSRIGHMDERVIKWKSKMQRSLKFSHPMLLNVSNDIINELGGMGSYLGAHIRTGDGIFKKLVRKNVDHVIEGMKDKIPVSNITNNENLSLDSCKLQKKQITFIATDSRNPHEDFEKIFSTFSCVFVLGDFKKSIDPLQSITYTFDKNIKMMDFFYPLLDLLIIANGMDVIVTPSSTFSSFAKYYHKALNL